MTAENSAENNAADSDDRYRTEAGEEDIERTRLAMLAAARDPKTFALLDRVGIGAGMHVLELGAGAGTVSAWMADRVGPFGRVMSTDIDLQFHQPMPDNVIVRRHDVEHEPLPDAHFDIVHARAVLQHVPTRDAVIEKLVAATKPGGWLVIEDGLFLGFAEQDLPEPYASLHRIIATGSMNEWHDPNYGIRVLGRLRALGCTDLDVVGDVWAMRPGEPGGEWWFLALERAFPRLVEAGIATQDDVDTALRQVREPGFVMVSTTSIATIGRRPEGRLRAR